VGDFNTTLSTIDKSFKQKINKEILEQNCTINLIELTDVYNIFHSAIAQYILLSSSWNFLQNGPYIRAQSLNKYKKIEIIPCILFVHNAIILDLNNKITSRKYLNSWMLNNTFFNDQ
jgi:hypothetical protein